MKNARRSARVDPHDDARVELLADGAELGPVAARLRDSRSEILKRWFEAAREQPFHAAHPDRAVADHIPQLFDALVAFLHRRSLPNGQPASPLDDPHIRDTARAHARDRFGQDLSPAEIVAEFRLLRQEIGRALREPSDRGAVLPAAELVLHDALDGATALGIAAAGAHDEARRRIEGELAAIVESSDDAILSKTLDGIITSWNPAAERLYGYSAAEVIGRSVELITPEDRRDELRTILERVARGERITPYETERVCKDGVRIPVSVAVSPVRDPSGVIIGCAAIARDISERKRAERMLRFHHELFGAAHEAIFAWSLQDGITFWNRGAEEQYGWSAPEAVGRSSHDLLGTPREQIDAFLTELRRKGRWSGELSHVTSDGRRLTVEARLALVTGEGGTYVVEATRDVTEQRQAEAALRLSEARSTFLAEAGRVLGSSLDYERTLASVAELAVPRVADWCAVDLLAEGGTLRRLAVAHVDPDKVRLAHELYERYPPRPDAPAGPPSVVRTGQSELVSDLPVTLLETAGRDPEDLALLRSLGMRSYMVVPVRMRDDILGAISFVAAESGRTFGTEDLAIAEELARRAGVAIENARLYREAQEEVRLREQLLAVVAHDLRIPLTAIKGTADLLQRQAVAGRLDPNRLADQTARISQAASGMANQIAELLDSTRLRAGQELDLNRRPTDIVALVFRVAAEVQVGTTQHTIGVEASVAELVGTWDPTRLERVLGNLLANAIKYSPEGGPVTVEVHCIERDGAAWACVSVRDRGVGIPATDLTRIFDRYHRAGNVVGRFPGEGIGLSGARQIVEQHGGRIDVESVEGQGSTFSVWLPVDETEITNG